jgi:hypothetical protein
MFTKDNHKSHPSFHAYADDIKQGKTCSPRRNLVVLDLFGGIGTGLMVEAEQNRNCQGSGGRTR